MSKLDLGLMVMAIALLFVTSRISFMDGVRAAERQASIANYEPVYPPPETPVPGKEAACDLIFDIVQKQSLAQEITAGEAEQEAHGATDY